MSWNFLTIPPADQETETPPPLPPLAETPPPLPPLAPAPAPAVPAPAPSYPTLDLRDLSTRRCIIVREGPHGRRRLMCPN